MNVQKRDKTRSLSVYEFFQILQIEWISADLRVRIYPQDKDKQYWNKVKEGKQRVIESIAEKNTLPTIFTDDEMKKALELKVYREKGAPNFQYKDEAQKQAQLPFDLTHYYSKGSEVRFEEFGILKIGKVKSYVPFSETILIEVNGGEMRIATQEVTRIL